VVKTEMKGYVPRLRRSGIHISRTHSLRSGLTSAAPPALI
jgi:hypothetical protein